MIRVLELIIVALFAITFVTQVFIPIMQDRKTFPIFRKTAKIEKEISDVKQAQYDAALEHEVEVLKEQLNQQQQTKEEK